MNYKKEILRWLLHFLAFAFFLGLASSLHLLSGIRHLDTAAYYVGIREKTYNRSPDIDRWNKYVGNPLKSPYCAAFGSYCIGVSGAKPSIKTGLARAFYDKSPFKYSSGEVLKGNRKVRAGDGIIWARGATINGHFGFALQNWEGSEGWTIEANTSAGSGSQHDGNGVYTRFRKIQPYSYFRIIGFTRFVYGK